MCIRDSGEPGTQLTMRTFHTGGIASAEDITQGLPRVEELFESRRPKSMAIMSEISGVVSQDDTKKNVVIKVTGKDENGAEEVKSYSIPFTQHARVMPGDRVEKGDIITREGVLYPQDILAIKGLAVSYTHLDVHYSHYGRMCPIETPEGPNIGLILSLIHISTRPSSGSGWAMHRMTGRGCTSICAIRGTTSRSWMPAACSSAASRVGSTACSGSG